MTCTASLASVTSLPASLSSDFHHHFTSYTKIKYLKYFLDFNANAPMLSLWVLSWDEVESFAMIPQATNPSAVTSSRTTTVLTASLKDLSLNGPETEDNQNASTDRAQSSLTSDRNEEAQRSPGKFEPSKQPAP